jgi:hypothetical protein
MCVTVMFNAEKYIRRELRSVLKPRCDGDLLRSAHEQSSGVYGAVKPRRINIKQEYLYIGTGMRIGDYVPRHLLVCSA